MPGYIKALNGAPLYAVYHPAAPVPTNTPSRLFPVLIAPPLFEERKSAYTTLRRIATKLAAAGHASLRFDYRGGGESGGAPGARRWQHIREDIASARKVLARLAGKRDAALVGLRLGATAVLQETLRVGGEGVIAIAPFVSGATQVRMWRMRTKIRSELTAANAGSASSTATAPAADPDAPLDFDGYDVHPKFFDDVAAIDLLKDSGALSCSGTLIQISHRTEPSPEMAKLKEALGSRARLEALRMEPFWDKLDDVETGPLEDLVVKTVAAL